MLLGKMAGAMLATLTKAAIVLNALPSQVARLAAALQDKRIADGETLDAPVSLDAESPADPAAVGVQAVSAEAPAEGADNAAAADESTTPEAVSTEAPAEGADAAVASAEDTTEETAAQA